MVNLLIIMYPLTFLVSVATESNKSPLREISCTIQVRKKYPLSRLRQILLARDFRSTAKCQYMKNEILIVTRDLGKNGGVWEAIVNKTVRGLGLCVFLQRFAMQWTLALFLASVFCSLYCWAISTKQRKELVSRDNYFINLLPDMISGTLSDKSWFSSVLKAVSPDLFFTSSDSAEVVFIFFLLTIYESFQLA